METFSIGQWKFSAGMVKTPIARKLISMCYINDYSFWEATNESEFDVVAIEVMSAEKACDEFMWFPRVLVVNETERKWFIALVRKSVLQEFQLTPAEQGRQDGIVAKASRQFSQHHNKEDGK